MPLVAAPQDSIHVARGHNVEREVPIIGHFVVVFFADADLAAEYFACHRFDAVNQRMDFLIANVVC